MPPRRVALALASLSLGALAAGCGAGHTTLHIGDEPDQGAAEVDSGPVLSMRIVSMPKGVGVDGDLAEWTSAPSLELARQPGLPRATMWIALDGEHLVVAAKVTAGRTGKAPRVKLGVALPEPTLPPLAFANQFGEQEVGGPEWCEQPEHLEGGMVGDGDDPVGRCKKWVSESTERRKAILDKTRRLLELGADGSATLDGKETKAEVKVVDQGKGSFTLEARLPSSALPMTAQYPLANARLRVELDDGTLLARSAPGSDWRIPGTWSAATLDEPVRFGRETAFFGNYFALLGEGSALYQPAPDTHAYVAYFNRPQGYQYAPELVSPDEEVVDLSARRRLGKLGELEVVEVPVGPDVVGGKVLALGVMRGASIEKWGAHGAAVAHGLVARGGGVHVIRVHEGLHNPLGAGACGACPYLSLEVVPISADGTVQPARELDGYGSPSGESVDAFFDPGYADFGYRSSTIDYSQPNPVDVPVEVHFVWNDKLGEYTRVEKDDASDVKAAKKKADKKKDTPKKDAPKKDAPKKDAPKKDAPKKDAPKKDAPAKKK
jgi:hypothetical protein